MATWTLTNPWGIIVKGDADQEDLNRAVFNAGHLEDIVRFEDDSGPITLVASETSGVWKVFPETNGQAQPLSLGWDRPNLSCLLKNAQHTHQLYAGGQSLHMSDLTRPEPLDNFVQIQVQDNAGDGLDHRNINRMTLLPVNSDISLLVLACDKGIFWVEIPPGSTTSYEFHRALITNSAGVEITRFSSVATVTVVSPDSDSHRVVAAVWGESATLGGLFVGRFSHGRLIFQSVQDSDFDPSGFSQAKMQRTSLAVSPAEPNVLYVLAGNQDDGMYCVVRGTLDASLRWSFNALTTKVVGTSDPLFGEGVKGDGSVAGGQQSYNNCIAVSPDDSSQVAVGWQRGYFLLSNARNPSESWKFLSGFLDHLHADIHALLFESLPSNALYICSDGGLTATKNFGTTHSSIANRHLPNLQMYNIALDPQADGVIASSLQDNGNAFCNIYPGPQPWKQFNDGDGLLVQFLRNGRLLDLSGAGAEDIPGPRPRFGVPRGIQERWLDHFSKAAIWEGQTQEVGLIPLEASLGTGLDLHEDPLIFIGLPFENSFDISWPLAPVETPTWKNIDGGYLVAVAANQEKVYGLLQGSASKDLHWSLLGSIAVNVAKPEQISCLGSIDGSSILMGTDQGSIFRMTPPSSKTTAEWAVELMTIIHPLRRGIDHVIILQFEVHTGDKPLAIASDSQILQLRGDAWNGLVSPANTMLLPAPNDWTEEYTGLGTDWSPGRPSQKIFLCTDRRVFVSSDNGSIWEDISLGLPRVPHSRDIRFVREPGGLEFLYVATYGWSVWRRQMNTPAQEDLDKFRDVSLSGDIIGITIPHFRGDHKATSPIRPQTTRISMTHPIEEMVYRTPTYENVWVQLKIRWEYHNDGSVEAKYEAFLNNAYSGRQDRKIGSILLLPAESKAANARLTSYDGDGDADAISDVDFRLAN